MVTLLHYSLCCRMFYWLFKASCVMYFLFTFYHSTARQAERLLKTSLLTPSADLSVM